MLADLRAFQEVAKEYEEGGDLGSAIAVARRATVWAPTEPAAWVFLAECLVRSAGSVASVLEKGDFFSEARQALQRALELEPPYTPAHLALGRFLVMTAYRNGGTPTPGMRHLQHVIEGLPVPVHGSEAALLAQAHFYLGMGYRTMGDESQAMACFNTALTHLPTFQPALLARQG
jgi:tetratricopeptide (TPR) repeat protein